MSLTKKCFSTVSDIHLLNKPVITESFIKDQELTIETGILESTANQIKIAFTLDRDTAASTHKEADKIVDGDGTEFDIKAEIQQHPDSLFVKCFAIEADVMNDNGDYFSKLELKKACSTFVGVPVFTNHQNSDINQAKGKVIYSWWDEARNGIMVIMRVDAVAYPQLARGIKQKYVTNSSMGAAVEHSICSACHNYAEVPDSYCGCIKERKTRKVALKNQKCKYHDHGPKEECPICGSTKKASKKFDYDGKVFEYNYGVKFIENSLVVTPAFKNCGITEVIDPEKFLAKVANISKVLPALLKEAEKHGKICSQGLCIKLSGNQELQDLNQALELMSKVSQSMLEQKAQIDLEFLSDLIKVMADLQTTVDELTEQGYGKLPSPGEEGEQPQGQQPGAPGATPAPVAGQQPTPTEVSPRVTSGPSSSGVGSVTTPTAGDKSLLKKYSIMSNHNGKSFVFANILNKNKGKKISILDIFKQIKK